MFLSSFTVLLCFACFIGENDASIETNSTEVVIPSEDVNDGWHEKFHMYDQNNDGLISAMELQQMLFKESIGLVTIRQAKRYISLLNRDGNVQIKLEKIKPIVDIMTEKNTSSVVDDDCPFNDEDNFPVAALQAILFKECKQNFFNALDETKEITNLIDQDGNGQIDCDEFQGVELMMEASLKLHILCEMFTVMDINKKGVITADVIADFSDFVHSKLAKSQEAKKAIENFDKNGDGVVDFSEFLNKIVSLSKVEFTLLDEFAKKFVLDDI
ncbi:uncharacterized protein LOC126837835 isoform X2 [Adelges cooleyi]|uniref:uncharacterized protein LOC126837553 isoform X2 n=1 Tax=Adelges cooleyi TaxID=133065 RepID=UPI00217F69CD|nr:uncharacterized protein LOC126837553 isoform X2 [Adelges cooleyi]XP_050427749.1 uncharacterized protein LOC126837835 isoform X2 [Adelges cooleyi]